MQGLRRSRRETAAILAGLVLAAAVAVLLLLGSGGSSGPPLRIEVFAKQYSWHFGYPTEGNAFSAKEFHVPDNRPIQFELHSDDVVHGFWIPEWDVNVTVVPGATKTVNVTRRGTGVFQVICSVNCGILHSAMKAKVVVEDTAQFQHWVDGLGPIPPHWKTLLRLDREAESIRRSVAKGGSG